MKRILCFIIVSAVLFSLCSCQRVGQLLDGGAETTVRPHVTVTPAPTLDNEPALLYKSVSTDQRTVSLVFEGFSDMSTMTELVSLIKERRIDCVFFVTGATAADHPEILQIIKDAGLEIGNYGITGKKNMQDYDVNKNMHQFSRTQELISQACGVTPTLFRCNGTEYTREVLQAAAACELSAGVEPSVFINHHSFGAIEDADVYIQRLGRGSIISVKLGQELDPDEYGQTAWRNEERPAYDPEPGISDTVDEMSVSEFSNVTPVVTWLLDALKNGGYTIVSPEALQSCAVTMFGEPAELDEETLRLLGTDQYTLPVTEESLTSAATRLGMQADFNGSVFVGDSITAALQSYVEWRRRTEPTYMANAQFLTNPQLTVETALAQPRANSFHPEYNGLKTTIENQLALMKASRVYLMLRSSDSRAYANEDYLQNYKLLLYLIRQKNPDIEICVLSLPPTRDNPGQQPTNMQLFRFNLFMCKLCRVYDLYFIDVAYALRDDAGALKEDYCIDPGALGTHLSDNGCEAWLLYMLQHIPTSVMQQEE